LYIGEEEEQEDCGYYGGEKIGGKLDKLFSAVNGIQKAVAMQSGIETSPKDTVVEVPEVAQVMSTQPLGWSESSPGPVLSLQELPVAFQQELLRLQAIIVERHASLELLKQKAALHKASLQAEPSASEEPLTERTKYPVIEATFKDGELFSDEFLLFAKRFCDFFSSSPTATSFDEVELTSHYTQQLMRGKSGYREDFMCI